MKKTLKKSVVVILTFAILLGVLQTVIISPTVKAETLPVHTITFGGHTYTLYDSSLTWYAAKAFCEEQGGHLVTITSKQEQEALINLAKNSSKKNLWIGASADTNHIFSWITDESFLYTNWAYGEPNDVWSREDSAMMYTQNSAYTPGEWNDEYAEGRDWSGYELPDFGFICEFEGIDDTKTDYSSSSADFSYSFREHDNTVSITNYNGTATNITIPSKIAGYTVSHIAPDAFNDNDNIESVVIPGCVDTIDYSAFYGCDALKQIWWLDGEAKFCYEAAFASCSSLTDLYIGETKYWDAEPYLFEACTSLKNVHLSDGISSIGMNMFAICSSLESISLPSSVILIDSFAFGACESLKTVCFKGTEEQWNDVFIPVMDGCFSDAQIVFLGESDEPEIAVDTTPFDLTQDGYAFVNGCEGFGYETFYNGMFNDRIPYERFKEVFGESFTKQQYKSTGTWGGNCFGMSVTSVLFNEGILNPRDYIPNYSSVNKSAYSGIKKNLWLKYAYTDKNSEITKLIERYQILQKSNEDSIFRTSEAYFQSENNKYVGSVDYIFDNFDNFLVDIFWKNSKGEEEGHTVVVDSTREPDPVPGKEDWYRIYIYDPNDPYGEWIGNKLSSYYSDYKNRYIEVNIKTNQWRVDVGINNSSGTSLVGYNYEGEWIDGSYILFYKANTNNIRTVFDGTCKFVDTSSSNSKVSLSCNNACIYDSQQTLKFQVEDGAVTYIADDAEIDVIPAYSYEDTVFNAEILLPVDTYTVSFNESGTAQIFNDDSFVGVVTDAGTEVSATADGDVTTHGDANTNTNVVLQNVNGDEYTSVDVDVTNDGTNDTSLSLDENNSLQYENSANDTFDVKVISDITEDEYLMSDITSAETENANISALALDDGQVVYNMISATVNNVDNIVFDGTEHVISPVVSYDGRVLEEGKDYTISGDTVVTEPGTYQISVTGLGDYYGTTEVTFSVITDLRISGVNTSTDEAEINFSVDKTSLDNCGFTNPQLLISYNGIQSTITDFTIDEDNYIFTFSCDEFNTETHLIFATLQSDVYGETYYSPTYTYCGGNALWQIITHDDTAVLTDYVGSEQNIVIPNKMAGYAVVALSADIFAGRNDISSVTIPECVTDIEVDAFANLENVTIKGYSGSYAQSYAVENDITFIALDSEEEIPVLKFSGASLTLEDNLTVNYKFNKAQLEQAGYTDFYAVFEINGVEQTIKKAYSVDGATYMFKLVNIAPNQMNDTITATLYATRDGEEYASEVKEYGIAQYCYNMLETYTSDEYSELRTLLVDLLNYGADSQVYTEHNTENLVNTALTDEQKAWGTADKPELNSVLNTKYETVENPTAQWRGAGLVLNNSITLRFMFTADNAFDLTAKISTDTDSWLINSNSFKYENGVYNVYFSGLHAAQMSENIYLTLYDGDKPVSNTVLYNVESYACSKQNGTDEKLAALVNSMMKYGKSAYAYAN